MLISLRPSVVRFVNKMMNVLAKPKIILLLLTSVAGHTGLSPTGSPAAKAGFLVAWLIITSEQYVALVDIPLICYWNFKGTHDSHKSMEKMLLKSFTVHQVVFIK